MPLPFHLSSSPPTNIPLARFLPRLAINAPADWLRARLPAGSWVLDPFGTSPQMAVALAQAGYRVLVAANNPIIGYLLEMLGSPPRADELRAVLAALASVRKGDERLETHLKNLYRTTCRACGAETTAHAFIWEKGAPTPHAVHLTCQTCHASGTYPTTHQDETNAQRFAPDARIVELHHARALSRVSALDDPDRQFAEEALSVYLPRAVYAAFNLINPLDRLAFSPHQRHLAATLLLPVLDQANMLWADPQPIERPKRLHVPQNFRENNLWEALEKALILWETIPQRATALAQWPDHPPARGGICLFDGRVKSLTESLEQIEISAVVMALPRQNPAYWTLSALWAGWLWGREAMGPFKAVLRRRRYDWAWQTTALESAFLALREALPPGTPAFGQMSELDPGFLSAALIASTRAGFAIKGIALQEAEDEAQFEWTVGSETESAADDVSDLIQKAVRGYLRKRGEPAPYPHIHAAAASYLAQRGGFGRNPDTSPAEEYTAFGHALASTLTYKNNFLRYGGSQNTLDAGLWWMQGVEGKKIALSDRVEMAIYHALSEKPITLLALGQDLSAQFPGLLTPARELVLACLHTYADETSDGWVLRPTDTVETRTQDLAEMQMLLRQIGTRLGYRVEEKNGLAWLDAQGKQIAQFSLQTNAQLDAFTQRTPPISTQSYIVVPGRRARLLMFKLQTNPYISQTLDGRWQFIKFRHLRHLANSETLTAENFAQMITLDPLTPEDSQMQLL